MPKNVGPSDVQACAVQAHEAQEARTRQEHLCKPTAARGVIQQGGKGHDRQEGADKKNGLFAKFEASV